MAGIHNFAKSNGTAGVNAVNTIFNSNSCVGCSAGAFYSLASDNSTSISSLVNCVIYNNTSNTGAALYANEDLTSNVSTTVANTIIWANTSTVGTGNLHFSGAGTPEI